MELWFRLEFWFLPSLVQWLVQSLLERLVRSMVGILPGLGTSALASPATLGRRKSSGLESSCTTTRQFTAQLRRRFHWFTAEPLAGNEYPAKCDRTSQYFHKPTKRDNPSRRNTKPAELQYVQTFHRSKCTAFDRYVNATVCHDKARYYPTDK